MEEKPMEDARVTEQVARSFLLGDVDTSERQRIESLFLTDPEIRQTILLVEDDLFEDYLEGTLSSDDAEKFRAQYASAPLGRRKLRIAQSLRAHASERSQKVSAPASVLEKLRLAMLGRPFYLRFALVTLGIVVMISAVWMGLRIRRTARDNSQQVAIERQLADLNSAASLNTKPPQMLSLTVAPILVRSVQSSSELTLQPSSQVIELQLLWTQKEEYSSYQAELGKVGSRKALKLPPLQLAKGPDGRLVRLRLPSGLFEVGLYRITLRGIGGDGAPETTEEYDFQIKR
jgi:hypothetical protein